MKYIYAICLFLAIFSTKIAEAQFEPIRNPQTPEEIALLKKNKVMAELQKVVADGKSINIRARAFDNEGRVLASISFNQNQYFMYDAAGRVIAHLDSVRGTDGNFIHQEYHFKYDEKTGKLQEAVIPAGTVYFTFDPSKNILTQSHSSGDSIKVSKYYFNADNKIYNIETFDQQNKLISKITRSFTSKGLLHREDIVGKFPSGTDSTILIYTNSAENELQRKQIFNFRKFLIAKDGGNVPTHSAEQQSISTLKYTYDKKGNKTSEEYTNSIDKLAHYYATWQYNEKGLTIGRTFRKGKAEPEIIKYEYGFFE